MTPVGMAAMKPFLQFLPSRLSIDSTGQHCTLLRPNLRISQNAVNRIFPPQSVAASTVSVVETKPDLALDNGKLINCNNVLACPICYKPLISNSDFDSSRGLAIGFELRCKTCRRVYSENESHFDLTITGGGNIYGEALPASTELFSTLVVCTDPLDWMCDMYRRRHIIFMYTCRISNGRSTRRLSGSPLVSFLYERGWRQSFSLWGGFPGPEKEFELIKEYLAPVLGGIIIDASCASGVFSRLFAKSGLFSLVFALDFSETMLQQCYEFIKQDENFPKEKIILVRADISRLPFASGSVDAVHAGAALHCWPSPSLAVAEISRVLRPGGMFVATTYLIDGLYSFIPFLRPFRQTVSQVSGSHIFQSEKELEDLCSSCGLENIKFTRNRRFVMISATKPN